MIQIVEGKYTALKTKFKYVVKGIVFFYYKKLVQVHFRFSHQYYFELFSEMKIVL